MRKLWLHTFVLVILALFATALSAQGQLPSSGCPQGLVCISPDAARQALQNDDLVKAQATEIRAKDDAITAYKAELNALRIELAKAIGEKTGAEQMNVRLTAIVDVLLKGQKKKCMPFSVCLF